MKKQIENIFSKTKTESEPKCPNPNTQIIVDTREKQSLIAANLFEQKANIKFEKLEIGDYLVGDTIIERKTFSDLVSSMINKRLQKQLSEIKKYPTYYLIIEGFDYNYEKFRINKNAIKGLFLSIALDFKVPIIFTEDEKDTANFLILTSKKYEKTKTEHSIRQTKTAKTSEEQKQFILEGFPGIGPALAKKLLKEFGSLKNIFNASEKDLEKIPNFNQKKGEEFLKLLRE